MYEIGGSATTTNVLGGSTSHGGSGGHFGSPLGYSITGEPVWSTSSSSGSSSGLSELSLNDLLPSVLEALYGMSNSAVAAEKEATKAANDFQLQLQKDAQAYNTREALAAFEREQSSAQKQMDFQRSERLASQDYYTEMSNSEIQRRVSDLKAAGLNPALAISGIGAASSSMSSPGSGSSASSSAATISAPSAKKADYSSAYGVQQRMLGSILSAAVTSAGNELSSSTKYDTSVISSVGTLLAVIGGVVAKALIYSFFVS